MSAFTGKINPDFHNLDWDLEKNSSGFTGISSIGGDPSTPRSRITALMSLSCFGDMMGTYTALGRWF